MYALLMLFIIISMNSALADDIMFLDDFEGGTPENWNLILGEWSVDDGTFCAVECSS
jgi:hypothetical protein